MPRSRTSYTIGRLGRVLASASVAVALVSLSACGSDSESTTKASSGPSSSGPSSSASGGATTTSTEPPLTGAATAPTSVPPQTGPKALLTAVRSSSHAGYDRVVFEFEGPAPGYNAAYITEPLKNDDSGVSIPIDGSSVFKVVFASAGSVDVGVELRETYTGPKRFKPSGTPVVAELVQVSDFEGYLTWAVGLRREAPFKVQQMSSPSRVVVDFES